MAASLPRIYNSLDSPCFILAGTLHFRHDIGASLNFIYALEPTQPDGLAFNAVSVQLVVLQDSAIRRLAMTQVKTLVVETESEEPEEWS